ncbi:DUF3784 domain-containing protein [Ruminococcus sp. OA3]|nr:DUF3784 domain-containing protein [Ruminococcus sp. OA3]MCH1983415.1 DUF3784 domain-containing protein [Ruminococcus sp. OA3]
MNPGFYFCIALGLMFLLCAAVFAVLKEKAAILVGGFNTMPKIQREDYDKVRISRDQRNSFLIWSLIMLAGGVCSYLVSQYAAVAAGVIWLIIFFRDVHLDEEKAFGKYKIK